MSDSGVDSGIEAPRRDDGSLVVPIARMENRLNGQFRFSLRLGLLAVTLIALMIGGIAVASRRFKVSSLEPRIRNEYHQIFLMIRCYDELKQAMPPAIRTDSKGSLLSSWRFNITPYYYSYGDIPVDFMAAWNSPANGNVNKWRMGYFCLDDSETDTSFFAVAGPGTAFSPSQSLLMSDLPDDLIVVMDVADSKVHWMQPGDYDVTQLLSHTGRIGDHLHGLLDDRFHVLFADGEVWALSPDAPMTALHPFLTIAGAQSRDREALLGQYRIR